MRSGRSAASHGTSRTCGCRQLVHLRRPGCIRGSAHRDDRPVEPAHRLLERVAGRLPAAVPGRVPGGADAGRSAPHSQPRDRQLSSTSEQHPSSSSRRTVPTHRLAKAFAGGARIGVRRIPMPSEAKIAAKVSVTLASRSRSRNLNCSMRSARSMRRVRACWATGSLVGLTVTPRMWTRRVETSSTNRTCRRLRKTVAAWKTSQAKIPRPGRPGTAARSGWRGVVPGRCRIV